MLAAGETVLSVHDLRELPQKSVVRIDNIANRSGFEIAIRNNNSLGDVETKDWVTLDGVSVRSDQIIKEYKGSTISVLLRFDTPDK